MRGKILTYSGRLVEPMALRAEDVTLADIAHSLALKSRFTGHCSWHYSVAQHSVLGSSIVSPSFALAFLLHDVSEAYLPDIAAPVKHLVRWLDPAGNSIDWDALEAKHAAVILAAIGCASVRGLLTSPEVVEADATMARAEFSALMPRGGEQFGRALGDPLVTVEPWTWQEAEAKFLNRFNSLNTRGKV